MITHHASFTMVIIFFDVHDLNNMCLNLNGIQEKFGFDEFQPQGPAKKK